MTRVLVVGGNGFLGSSVVDELARSGHDVRVLDRMSRPRRFDADVDVAKVSLSDPDGVDRATAGVEVVIHAVWESTPISADSDPFTDLTRNVEPSVRLMRSCVKNDVRRIVFFSTAGAMYGSSSEPSNENTPPRPISPYGIGKLAVEGFLEYYERRYGISRLVYRISNPYGSRQAVGRDQGVIPIFLGRIAAGRPIVVFGNGMMTRDYVYADDAATIIATNFDRDLARPVYNLGSGLSASVNEVIALAEEIVGRASIRSRRPQPRTFIENSALDVSALVHDHRGVSITPFKDGVARTWEAMLTATSKLA